MTCGVYKITNKINGNFYIGSTFNIEGRWCAHVGRLKTKQHANSHLQADADQYGVEVFVIEILEELPISLDDTLLRDREIFWLEQAKQGQGDCYNIRPTIQVNPRPGSKICDICGKRYRLAEHRHLHVQERKRREKAGNLKTG